MAPGHSTALHIATCTLTTLFHCQYSHTQQFVYEPFLRILKTWGHQVRLRSSRNRLAEPSWTLMYSCVPLRFSNSKKYNKNNKTPCHWFPFLGEKKKKWLIRRRSWKRQPRFRSSDLHEGWMLNPSSLSIKWPNMTSLCKNGPLFHYKRYLCVFHGTVRPSPVERWTWDL